MLYVLSPPSIGGDFFSRLDRVLATGVPKLFQLRLKNISDADYIKAATEAVSVCRRHNVLSYINDRADIAAEAGADGVHIGAEDITAEHVRLRYPGIRVGVSCYDSIDLAEKAVATGANYVSFGAFFPTTTKQAKTRATLSLLTRWKSFRPDIPACAIGGITAEHLPALRRAGTDYVAVVGSIWNADIIEDAVLAFA